MEIRLVLRGVLAGLIAGVLGFVFARIWAEPVINASIAYENGRDEILAKLNNAAGRATASDGPNIVSRHVQSTAGLASGIVLFSLAMGALVAVGYLVLHARFDVRPRTVAWLVAAFGFAGVYLLPFVKYPADPPAVGHSFTITTRGHLYLVMVASSLVLLALAVVLARRLKPRVGLFYGTLIAGAAFFIVYGVLIGVLPALGDLPANVHHTDQFGFARASTETPQPITNVLSTPLVLDGRTIQPGQLVYPGFDADVLWKFRWYSLINQALIWFVIALCFGVLLERHVGTGRRSDADHNSRAATPGDPGLPARAV